MTALAMAAMMMASCASNDDGLKTEVKPEQPTEVGKTPVSFSAYAERGITRGGTEGLMDISALRNSTTGGFGVFAYYTDLKKYDQTYVPNFMYNQKVYDANNNVGDADWTYSPVMYWPNESGTDAQSDDEDKVSFFAYAPYVQHTSAASGSVADATYGITGFSRNTAAGDPLVKYIANFNTANTVDLCWGVCNEPNWAKIQGGTSQSMTAGLPWLDVEHPQTTGQKMNFTFKHALAQLNVQIDADVNITGHATDDVMDANTKVYVRSISFTGIAMKGALNLNNTVANTAQWLDYSGTTDLPYGESVTVKDGRRDGREGTSGAEATNETTGLNPEIIQNSTATSGVTTTYQNLFSPSGAIADPLNPTDDELAARLKEPVYVIPTGEAMTVTIVYDVETANPSLAGYLSDGTTHGSSIENKITKTIYYGGEGMSLESGKKYTLTLHLGMNSVKFDASVDSWDNTIINANGWLPENVSAVRIMKGGVQVTHATAATSETELVLTGDVHPTAADQSLTWTSSDPAVASFADASSGTVTLNTDGECVITATSTATGKTATMKLLVTHKYSDVVAADVRRVIAANGYIYDNTTQAAEYGTNGVGIICYAGAAGSADASTTYDASAFKALAWALTDANDGATCQWKDENTDCTGLTNVSGYANARLDKTGIDNTNTLLGDGHTHAAATAAHDYAVVITGFTNSGWFLPAEGQWNMMMMSLMNGTTYEDGANRANATGDVADYTEEVPEWTNGADKYWHYGAVPVNKVIEPLGATPVQVSGYWSSTEYSAASACHLNFYLGTLDTNIKTYQFSVRPVFAF